MWLSPGNAKKSTRVISSRSVVSLLLFSPPPLFCADDADESLNDHDDGSIKENFREQDIYLPIANVARIMKNAVPQTGKVSFQLLLLGWFGLATAWAQRGRWLQPASKEQMLV